MPRARLIKPGFFSNEDLLDLPFETRLLFAGLWTIADRSGRLEDRPKRIKIELFPADNVDVDAMLQVLNNKGFIHRYTVAGQSLAHVRSFANHQSPHPREPLSKLPACDCEPMEEAKAHAEPMPSNRPDSDKPPARQGKAGTGPAVAVSSVSSVADNSLTERRGTPVPIPKKSVVTEEWLASERALFRERLPASGFWSFDRVLSDRMNGTYFKSATDKRAYLHGQFENAAERVAGERNSNGNQLRTNPQSNNRMARTAPGPRRIPDMVVGD